MTSTPVRLDRAQIEAAARRHMHCESECDVPALLLHAAALEAELAAAQGRIRELEAVVREIYAAAVEVRVNLEAAEKLLGADHAG